MRMTAMLICFCVLLVVLTCVFTSCDFESRPVARVQEQGYATVTYVAKNSSFHGIHRHDCRIRVENEKYNIAADFNSCSVGMWNKPKYWDCREGDIIEVIVNIEYYTDDNTIRRVWITETSN